MSEFPYSVAIVSKEPFGSVAFTAATAMVEDDGSILIIYADPEFEKFDEIWERFAPGSWREVDVLDTQGYPLVSFVAAEEQARRDAAVARRTA